MIAMILEHEAKQVTLLCLRAVCMLMFTAAILGTHLPAFMVGALVHAGGTLNARVAQSKTVNSTKFAN